MPARNGKSYIEGLRDGREVWLNGKKVRDVTEEPQLRPVIDATARLYDLQHDPEYRDILTVESPELGERIGRTYQAPKTLSDLVMRRRTTTLWMEQSCGFLGRAPDFLNTMITAMKEKSSFFAQQSAERQAAMDSYYAHAASRDLFLTHALHDPQTDRSKRRSQQPDPGICLHVVEENRRGIVVSGAKVVATGAAYADEILLWPAVPNFGPGDEPYALACVIPINAPGLKILCRPSFTHVGRTDDYPLSSRFDEMDSVIVFDRVLVPWDRVFLHGDRELITKLYAGCRIRELTAHQTNTRLQVKLEFLYALLVRMAESIGVEKNLLVGISLGEAASYIEIIRACVLASEYQAEVDPDNGVLYPDFSSLVLGRLMGPRLYPEFIHKIRRLGSSGLMQVPHSLADLDSPLGPELERYYRGAQLSAREKILLARCAWDICGSDFGSRHSLYELFYGGDPDQNFERMQREYPRKAEHLKKFDRFFNALLRETQAPTPALVPGE
ncbi:MAG TPA: 4-hydroxyphenylacetate 3-hydroxylase N-terminal domain-containing protein [Stellaceae bacterium]